MSPYLAVFLSWAYSFTVILILLINMLNSFLKLAVKLTIWNCLPNTSLHSNIYYVGQVPPSVLSLRPGQFLYIGVILHPKIVSYGLSLAFYCFFFYTFALIIMSWMGGEFHFPQKATIKNKNIQMHPGW